jgi:peptide/nickel transport system permease protein
MAKMIGKKVLTLIPVLLVVSFITYVMLDLLPGDPALQVLGAGGISPEAVAQVRADLRLDDPLPVRYLGWLGDAVQGDFGRSYQTRQEVSAAIFERLPVTLEIAVLAMVMSLLLAIPLGVISAYRAGTKLDRGVTGATFGLLAVPNFMMALLLIYTLSVRYGWFPATGWEKFGTDPLQNLKSAFMPSLALAVSSMAVLTRLLRTDMIATLQEDHVLLARSKGLPTWRILFRHALRPSSFSLLTVGGLQVGALLGGAVIVEQIFALPGLGRLLLDAIFQRDLLIVQGAVLLVAVMYVLVNATVDVLYTFLDPRIRHGASRANA